MMLTPWAPDPWLVKVYATRPAPALTTAPASLPLPAPRDLGEDAKRLRADALRAKLPDFIRELRGGIGLLRGGIRAARSVEGTLRDVIWAKQADAARRDGRLIHCVVMTEDITSQGEITRVAGLRIPDRIPVYIEHDDSVQVGWARVQRCQTDCLGELILDDTVPGLMAAQACLAGQLWAVSAGYGDPSESEEIVRGGRPVTVFTRTRLIEISLTGNPKNHRCRARSTASPLYPSFAHELGIPIPTKEKTR